MPNAMDAPVEVVWTGPARTPEDLDGEAQTQLWFG